MRRMLIYQEQTLPAFKDPIGIEHNAYHAQRLDLLYLRKNCLFSMQRFLLGLRNRRACDFRNASRLNGRGRHNRRGRNINRPRRR